MIDGSAATACPACESTLPDTGRFPAWCPSCNWNLESRSSWFEWKETSLDKLINKVRGGHARKQFEALAAREPGTLRPSWTLGKIVTYALAALVNFFPLLLLLGGLG